ncbi:curli-like amyloid fiber formation chaperone CsgH [uncultured Maricaulis sp.]|mgnify:CR=1 FL=1|uniref:curli-like amyloid fiber formation chaperone CsgH n=1 Tax=uncultured Maricaulis sp. TaxID=174710 RepID=UPI0030D7404D|tara:strand:+ start:82036 stop:82425 length:390 start_codon:yes stop_codon:yes gene_type:complete
MSINILAVNAMAIAGAALIAIQPGEPVLSDQPGVNFSNSACHIEMAETPDGLLVTAWGMGDAGSNYRMVVTQRMGGGGFDIVQEGDVPAGGSEDALLSDILLDTDANFSARLSTWNATGELVCRWDEQA